MTANAERAADGPDADHVVWFQSLGRDDVAQVGGKNASLGEMIRHLGERGVAVPPGFATTAAAYRAFMAANGLVEVVTDAMRRREAGEMTLAEAGHAIREAFHKGRWPDDTAGAIRRAYGQLSETIGRPAADVAVRSSATAEDLPEASFAGQQESFLNIEGEGPLLEACRRCYASLFTDRAISYREAQGFDHLSVALSVGVQAMVRSDRGGAGVMFTVDPETGFDKVVVIDAAWGLGEMVVKGSVDPDAYQVFKPLLADPALTPIVERRLGAKARKMIYAKGAEGPTRTVATSRAERAGFVLSDAEILQLARWGCAIEDHYGCGMDVEWARDGDTGALWIVQARPETVQSRRAEGAFRSYRVTGKGKPLAEGIAVGDLVATGRVCLLDSAAEIDRFVDGGVLVTATTDPDWVPIMKRAAAIVTDHGGRTSHAAIVSRELGLPAIVGAGDATRVLHDGQEVTVSCAEGDRGVIYDGFATVESEEIDPASAPATRTKVMLNLGNPGAAFRWWRLPADGVGLARMEFVITNHVRVHPMALVHFDRLEDAGAKREIEALTAGHPDRAEYFVDRLSRGLARIAAAVHPRPAIIRMSDFKTNEYAGLIGGAQFEPHEENPMLGFRGAARYVSPRYREGFALECRAIRRLRAEMGFANVVVMIPFCRSVTEADRVLAVMAENGLTRGEDGLEVYVMAEIPSNIVQAEAFAERFDGFSIGSNDLTQLTLGVDRDSADLAESFDERDPAVQWMIAHVIAAARKAGAKIGLCGQGPSDHPEIARFLVDCGIDAISVTPDSFLRVKTVVAEAEAAPGRQAKGGRA